MSCGDKQACKSEWLWCEFFFQSLYLVLQVCINQRLLLELRDLNEHLKNAITSVNSQPITGLPQQTPSIYARMARIICASDVSNSNRLSSDCEIKRCLARWFWIISTCTRESERFLVGVLAIKFYVQLGLAPSY